MRSASSPSHGIDDALRYRCRRALVAAAVFAYLTGTICLRTTRRLFHHDHAGVRPDGLFLWPRSLAPYGGDDGLTIHTRSTLFGLAAVHAYDGVFYYVVLTCLLGVLSAVPRAGRVALRPRAPRRARECHRAWRRSASTSYRYQLTAYVIAGALGGLAGFLLANADRFRQPRLHVVAALRRTDLHDPVRRARHAARRDHRRLAYPAAGRMAVRRSPKTGR